MNTDDRQQHIDTLARLLTDHLFTVDASAYGSESCACGWRCDGWDGERYETHLARTLFTSTDPAVHDALTAALIAYADRGRVLAALADAGWLDETKWMRCRKCDDGFDHPGDCDRRVPVARYTSGPIEVSE